MIFRHARVKAIQPRFCEKGNKTTSVRGRRGLPLAGRRGLRLGLGVTLLPLPPIVTEQFHRVRRADCPVAAAHVVSGTEFVAAPADSFRVLRMDRKFRHTQLLDTEFEICLYYGPNHSRKSPLIGALGDHAGEPFHLENQQSPRCALLHSRRALPGTALPARRSFGMISAKNEKGLPAELEEVDS